MKMKGSVVRGNGWVWVAAWGVLIPNFALATKSKPMAQEACESQASSTYKKKSVELAMATIVGNMSELEATSEREGLQRRLDAERAHCLRVEHTASRPAISYASEQASTGAL